MTRIKRRHNGIAAFALALMVILPAAARAELFGFARITDNASIDIAGQLSVEVTDAGGGQVSFKFYNDGPGLSPYDVSSPIDSSITDVYFDDGTLLGIASISNGSGVAFDDPATPGNLPGATLVTPPFVTTDAFSADSDPPIIANGVDQGEWVKIIFNLVSGQTFADVLAAINLGFTDPAAAGSLRIGIHVQSIGGAGGDSDSFIMTPVPGAAILGLLGLGIAGLKLRKLA